MTNLIGNLEGKVGNTGESSMTKDSEYTTVQIPNDLLAEVDALIGKHGFKTRPEVVKEALRILLDQYKEA